MKVLLDTCVAGGTGRSTAAGGTLGRGSGGLSGALALVDNEIERAYLARRLGEVERKGS